MQTSAENHFHGRHVLLTGAGSAGQTGEVIAREFARHGAVMILVGRKRDQVEERVSDLVKDGYEAQGFACDLTSEPDVASMAREATALCGAKGLAALINGAGGFHMSDNVADSSFDIWQRQFNTNLVTCYLATRALLPLLRKGRGAVVNFATGSVLPYQKVAGMSAYVAAKGGVTILTRAVAQEEKKNGVRANAVAPTAIRTASNLASMGADGHYVEREEVAQTVFFLCSPAAAAITGEVIRLA